MSSPHETLSVGEKLGNMLRPGDLVCLVGDLGTGKTHFAQGIARGLGVTDAVNSPSYTIIQEYYSGKWPLYHFDVYRLDDPEELYDLGYEDYFFGDGITLVEWADKIVEFLPSEYLVVEIERSDGSCRIIRLKSIGGRFEPAVERFGKEMV